jgi:hypothetical protein
MLIYEQDYGVTLSTQPDMGTLLVYIYNAYATGQYKFLDELMAYISTKVFTVAYMQDQLLASNNVTEHLANSPDQKAIYVERALILFMCSSMTKSYNILSTSGTLESPLGNMKDSYYERIKAITQSSDYPTFFILKLIYENGLVPDSSYILLGDNKNAFDGPRRLDYGNPLDGERPNELSSMITVSSLAGEGVEFGSAEAEVGFIYNIEDDGIGVKNIPTMRNSINEYFGIKMAGDVID